MNIFLCLLFFAFVSSAQTKKILKKNGISYDQTQNNKNARYAGIMNIFDRRHNEDKREHYRATNNYVKPPIPHARNEELYRFEKELMKATKAKRPNLPGGNRPRQ
jgi:hypothetical protein